MPPARRALDSLAGTRHCVDPEMADNWFSPDSRNLRCVDPPCLSFPSHNTFILLHSTSSNPHMIPPVMFYWVFYVNLCTGRCQHALYKTRAISHLSLLFLPHLRKKSADPPFPGKYPFLFSLCSNNPQKGHQKSLSPLLPPSLHPPQAGFYPHVTEMSFF